MGKTPQRRAPSRYTVGSIGRAMLLNPEVFTEERKYVKRYCRLKKAPSGYVPAAEWLVADQKKSAAND